MLYDYENGTVKFRAEEVKLMAKVLDLGRELAEQLGAEKQYADGANLEVKLLEAINQLASSGISADDLHDVVDRRFGRV